MEVKVNMNLAGTIVDEEAHKLSAIIDADSDRQRIADNPGTQGYRRPASELERVACGLGDSPTAITDVTVVIFEGHVATHRLTWDPAKRERPQTVVTK